MNFVADECCDALLVEALRQDGHDVVYIKDVARGADDETILQLPAGQQRVLLTEDKDFRRTGRPPWIAGVWDRLAALEPG